MVELIDLIAKGSQATLLVLFAAFGVWIARQQMITARIKLQLDLFDRRFQVYSAMIKFTKQIVTERVIITNHIEDLMNDTAHATFLFESDLVDKIVEFRSKAVKISFTDIRKVPSDREPLELWFSEQPLALRRAFAKYLEMKTAAPRVFRGRI